MTVEELRRAMDRRDLWADRTRAHAAADEYMRRAHELERGSDGSDETREAIDMLWTAYASERRELAPQPARRR